MKKSNAVATGRKQTAPAPSATLPSAELAANQAPAPAPADPKAAGPREPERKQKRKPKPEPEARTEPEAAPLPTMPTVTELATLAATFAPFLATHTDLDDRARFGNSDIIRPALDLWLASREILAIAKNRKPTATEVVLAQIHANAVAVAAIQWPSPKDYPIDASKLAYLAVPKLNAV
ncbi:MAG TPA: hypothetical protein P5555_21055 [Candidatus Paceibacterota bacterium]|nr:hypothetical protein [Verrucomicrobiota bacterium]HRZ47671.1 hypothetical protein [Candidatus Paceibacterota bacterium]HRZ94125.1 hypothetical protein [Candidatus Paceibacterota bacterium]